MLVEERLTEWLGRYEGNGYLNGSLLIASNGNIVVNKGFGMANHEHQVPNTPFTKFRIGSLTKAFTAFSIFQLHENGEVNINDPIKNYVPDYPNGENITIYHCLTNTSGIPDFTSFPDFWFKTMRLPSTLNQLIDSFKDQELDFEPGTRFGYSNSGYALLTAIIENVSGMVYGDYIHEKICLPLGMDHTGCDDGIKVVPGLASGYSFWEEPIHSAHADLSFPLGGYGMYSTVKDLFIWDKALRSSQLIDKELTEKMFAPYLGSYACGWAVSEILGKKCEHHFGDISGFSSSILRFPDEQMTIILLSNINITPVAHLTKEIAKTVFSEEVSLPILAKPIRIADLNFIAGKYLAGDEPNIILEITIKDSGAYLTVPKMYGALYKFKLVPVAYSPAGITFITEMLNEQLVFRYSLAGKARVEYRDSNDNTFLAYREL